MHDCVIVGAGPAGLSATLRAMELELDTVTIDQESIGGTVAHFPRGKLVMTAPAHLPLVGPVRFSEISKEKLLGFWEDVVEQQGVIVRQHEAMVGVTPMSNGGYQIVTNRGQHHARSVLLAIGRRGTPRKLGVAGEDRPKVIYRLTDPEQYAGQHVLVVGGGDSAIEAACSIAELDSSTVSLSYRGDAFKRAKPKNRDRLEQLTRSGDMNVLLRSDVVEITDEHVVLTSGDESVTLPNSSVIVCAGGILPTPLLKTIGIEVVTKYGTE